jgi:hypothetical protein
MTMTQRFANYNSKGPRMLILSRLFLCMLPLLWTAAANAAAVTYNLAGVTLSDGGTASGSFNYDAATNTYSDLSIVTTTTGTRSGATYTTVSTGFAADSKGVLAVTTSGSSQGLPGLTLFFSPILPGPGGVSTLSGQEADCADAGCTTPSGTSRTITGGTVSSQTASSPRTWYLNGVTFGSGGSASGSFTFDPGTNLYTNVNITTTVGTRGPATYSQMSGGLIADSTGVLFVTSAVANQTGQPGFSMVFATPLTGAGGTSALTGQEADCGDPSCTMPTGVMRFISTGSVTTVPTLTINKSHVGNFSQGQVGVQYTVNINNTSVAATVGQVTMTETPPSGLTITGMSGTGWTCSTSTCTRSDALAGGGSYPTITITGNISSNATSPLVNQVSVSGGGSASINATDSATIIAVNPSLTITKTHSGNFTQGQTGVQYNVTVGNSGSIATSGTVTMTENPPAGLTITGMAGTGWTCNTATCTRSDALNGGSSYPVIVVTGNVSFNATSPLVNQVSATGGGSGPVNANDSTTINPAVPGLTISKTHSGSFVRGQTGAQYSVIVGNNTGVPTSGLVTMTETPPSGLTITGMTGTGWTCNLSTCTRSDALNGGATYPAITVTVNVSAIATSPQVNQVSVSGGGANSANASDSTVIALTATLSVNRTTLNFGFNGLLITSPQTVLVSVTGGGVWTAISDHSNITVNPGTGVGTGTFQVAATAGPSGTITVTSPGATNSPQVITVNVASVLILAPFGSFDTPLNNTTGVTGAIPVTGWALDNIEVTRVDIFREPINGEPAGNLIFIGTAVFSADARPDVAATYPTFPYQYRAGWGYQLLTNELPNSSGFGPPGNGTYKLHAIVVNKANNTLDLGTRTITVDNAHAVKPFGTLDTPTQGGTISGNDYVNFGWALTPQPAMIPTDGSTITVIIDGTSVGHPVYNQYRSDIANLFPGGYANINGAVGYFHINTTTLANGVHTISWNVFDNQGHGEGLGSRFFNVQNTGPGPVAAPEEIPVTAAKAGVRVRHGMDVNSRFRPIVPDSEGGYSVTMEEVGLIELHLGAASGNMLVDGAAQALPTGSTLKGGVFYWQPGPGFVGDYTMQFERPDGTRIPVRVKIVPKRF